MTTAFVALLPFSYSSQKESKKKNIKNLYKDGLELDANIRFNKNFSMFAAGTYTDATYVRFTNAPLPLEETGLTVNGVQVAFKDISVDNYPEFQSGQDLWEVNLPPLHSSLKEKQNSLLPSTPIIDLPFLQALRLQPI